MAEKIGQHCYVTPKCGIRTCQTTFNMFKAPNKKDENYKFIVVRNPYSRMVSFYSQKIAVPNMTERIVDENGYITNRSSVRIPHVPFDARIDVTFSKFMNLVDQKGIGGDRHLRPQVYKTDNIKFDRIVHLESWAEDIELVGKDLDLGHDEIIFYQERRINVTKKNHSIKEPVYDNPPEWFEKNGIPDWEWFYNDDLKKIVRKHYRDDFIRFEYAF